MAKLLKKNLYQYKVTTILFFYWFLVIMWQTFRPVANRSLVDIGVKFGLLFVLLIYAVKKKNISNKKGVVFFIIAFVISQTLTYIVDTAPQGITGYFNLLMVFMQVIVFLVMLGNETISKEEIKDFGKWVIVAALIMAFYNMIFSYERFQRVFDSNATYGSESKSFLYSNHEFAVYLSTGIIFLMWFLFQTKKIDKFFYLRIVAIAILFINVLSTNSRTATFGILGAFYVFMFFYNKKAFAVAVILGALFMVLVNNVETLHDFVYKKVLKDSYESSGGIMDNGRSSQYEEEWQAFKNAPFINKIFGYGWGGSNALGGHDAYLRMLLLGGVVMEFFFIAVILYGIVASFVIYKYNRISASMTFACQIFAILYMVGQTPILFYSMMDCYFITITSIVVPLYISNYYTKGKYLRNENTSN